jgi:hypothetical protein
MIRPTMAGSTKMILAALAAALVVGGSQSACSKKEPTPDVAKARPVMDQLLEAERQRRASIGTFWRDRQAKLDRNEVFKIMGVDLNDAPGFEFTIEDQDSGMDPKLRVTARGKGEASNVFLTCIQDSQGGKPECTESAAKPS